jgi:Protein of unknown function (DUF2934)
MAEKEKKAKAPAKPRKTVAKKVETAAEVTPIDQPRVVSHEDVARLAHRFWAERGHQHGNPAEDWFRAEQELRGKA